MKLLWASLLLTAVSLPLFAQQQPSSSDDTVVMKKSDLTSDQLAKVQSKEVTDRLEQYQKYAEMGRGVGIAVKESLGAVKDVAVDFSKTDVGKFTMFLIAWKIMAKDVVDMGNQIFGYIVGIPFFALASLTLLWSYRQQCIKRRVLIKTGKEGKEWKILDPDEDLAHVTEGEEKQHFFWSRSEWATAHGAMFLLIVILSCLITFHC